MLSQNRAVFRLLVRQVGVRAAIRHTLAKIASRLLTPHAKRHYSQTGEDLILQTLVERYLRKNNFFYVDVGCHDARKISSTFLHYLAGASGVNIDLGAQHALGFAHHRPRDTFLRAAISREAGFATLTRFQNSEVDSIDAAQTEKWRGRWTEIGTETVPTDTLDATLKSLSLDRKIDVLLLDVEGHELDVLSGFSFDVWRPQLVVCEIHDLDLLDLHANAVYSHIVRNGYRLQSYATMNAYFVRDAGESV